MRIYEEYDIPPEPARKGKRPKEYKCDLCGASTGGNRNWWDLKDGGAAEQTVQRQAGVVRQTLESKRGYFYPEGGHGTEEIFDMCPKCWDEKFVPWMKSQGATPRHREVDY